jgi:hypothetical protein
MASFTRAFPSYEIVDDRRSVERTHFPWLEGFMKYTDLNLGDNFLTTPIDRVIGLVDAPGEARASVADLNSAGFGEDDIALLCGRKGAERLDVTGEEHGLLARFYRLLENSTDVEARYLREYRQNLLDGHFVLLVSASNDAQKTRALRVLAAHNGYSVRFYGLWTIEDLTS